MKRLFLFVPVILPGLFLLNSFVLKEKETGETATKVNKDKSAPANIVFKSTDGGQTWQDISKGLPGAEQPVNFFAGESDLYLQVKNVMYHSKSNLQTPVWEEAHVPGLQNGSPGPSTSIAFNRSGVMAFNDNGQIYEKTPAAETWLPIHTNFKNHSMRTIFETADGAIFLGYNHGLYKSANKGKSWKQVQNQGWVANIVESGGVLLATGTKGIMRSTDNGENWQWVLSEGGVGIAIERIEGGFAAISYNTETKSRRIRVSSDSGKTWQAVDEGLRPSGAIASIKQIGKYLICGHPDGIFRSSDMGKTWSNVHPATVKKEFKFFTPWNSPASEPGSVFRIYVSGNALYAVAGSTGC